MKKPLINNWKIHLNIILYAFDYCLKRNTYAPSEFVENIKANKEMISSYMIDYMLKEIKKYKKTDYFKKSFSDIQETWLHFEIFLLTIND